MTSSVSSWPIKNKVYYQVHLQKFICKYISVKQHCQDIGKEKTMLYKKREKKKKKKKLFYLLTFNSRKIWHFRIHLFTFPKFINEGQVKMLNNTLSHHKHYIPFIMTFWQNRNRKQRRRNYSLAFCIFLFFFSLE